MTGIDAQTGKALGGVAHLLQSVRDVLSTPIGSRVLLRSYGSRLFELLDRPLGPPLLALMQAEAADALARWEPRLRLRRVRAERISGGHVTFLLDGEYLPDGGGAAAPVRLDLELGVSAA